VKRLSAGTLAFGKVMTYSLNEELEHESRCRKTSELVREDPSWNQTGANECSNAHRTPTADPLREVADDCTTNAGTSLHQNTRCRSHGVVHALFSPQERGVAVLACVGVEVEPLHDGMVSPYQ
jgi:hypothetical protein